MVLEVRIPQLTPANPLTGTELVWLSQNGGSVKAQLSVIATLIGELLDAWTFQSTDYAASSGDRVAADTNSGPWTLTLPPSPTQGNTVEVLDAGGAFAINALSVTSAAETIEGLAPPMSMTLNRVRVVFTFNGATWKIAGE